MTTTAPLSQAAIGRALGISPAAMTKCKAKGMPVNSVEAARAWREANLHPLMTKDSPMRWTPPAPAVPQTTDRLAAAQTTLNLAADLMGIGQNIDYLLPGLRTELAAVPYPHRARLLLPVGVMDVLVSHVLALLPQDRGALVDGAPVWTGGTMTDDDAEWLGSFWYGVAAGEIVVT